MQSLLTVNCKHCGKEILYAKGHGNLRYCSADCRYSAHKKRHGIGKVHSVICVVCGKTFEHNQKDVRYCSSECRKEKYRQYTGRFSRYPNISTGTVGALTELEVAADLLKKGYEVFRSLSPSASCDLAVLQNGVLRRIEVRTAYRGPSGVISTTRNGFRADHFAFHLGDEIVYEPALL